ncbi:TPM domain-containing protein [Salisaeta longa]|uniref:TPM domain-containing protein n=1 Tax=Salisaeta longa TaxID=503170 RepID=UPI000490A14C|nr:hypothetical protein [Salisaeta longa]
MPHRLSTLDEDRIRAAVAAAEERTAGEIVPYVVTQSDDYEIAVWRGAVLGALLGSIGTVGFATWYTGWAFAWLYEPAGALLLPALTGLLGALLGNYVPAVMRRLVGRTLLDVRVHRRALQAFLTEEVFNTRDRTGILLFVSLREHRIEVLGDTGINAQVPPEAWADVVATLRHHIKTAGDLTAGLVDAIEQCGRLLERKGVAIRPDDTDELSNRVRTPDANDD